MACTHIAKISGIPLYAPADLAAFLDGKRPTFLPEAIADDHRVEIGDIELAFSRTDHGNETFAVRAESGGKVLGYSADSGPAWSMEALGTGIDLALCEATFLQDREGSMQHLSARQAGATARAAGAERLVATHVWPTVDRAAVAAEAESSFGRPVEVAVIDAVYEV